MQAILDFYNNTLGTVMPKELFCFFISMVPVLELRAGLVIATLLKIPILPATLICVAGNICIVPFALLFLDKLIWLLSHIKPLGKFFDWIKSKTKEKGEKFEKGELIGLAFDGNWDSLSSDIFFDKKLARCIGVDIRFVLFMMDRWGHADRLLKEINAK